MHITILTYFPRLSINKYSIFKKSLFMSYNSLLNMKLKNICFKQFLWYHMSEKKKNELFFAYMNNRRYDSCLKKSTSFKRFLIYVSEHYLKIIISWSILSMVSFFMEMQSSDDYGCHDIGCLLRTKEMESSKNL